jgi:8-oxo-dGTP diphosphatase
MSEQDDGGYRNPALTVDAVVLRDGADGREGGREVLLIRRGGEPWKGCWAFPGGFVDYGEDPEVAVVRELAEECGVEGRVSGIISVRGEPGRDPRGHVVTIFYAVEVASDAVPVAGDDAAHAEWVPLAEVDLSNMGADHAEVIKLIMSE